MQCKYCDTEMEPGDYSVDQDGSEYIIYDCPKCGTEVEITWYPPMK